jgi:riboflavin kinase/FMN adenylyltransferase
LKRISFCEKPQYAAALGLFDGVHRGHGAVFDNTVKAARSSGLTPAAVTFSGDIMPHKTGSARFILSDAEKRKKLSEYGIEAIITFPFSEIKDTAPYDFIKTLTEKYGIAHIICGEDFRFGKDKAGDINALRDFSKKLGFGLTITPEKLSDGVKISSGAIREKLCAGDIKTANSLLGYEFYYRLKVTLGNKIGRSLGFPTINQVIPKNIIMPQYGVYISKTAFDGKIYNSLSNIGIKPTVDYVGKPLIETYIEGFDGDLYDRIIKVSLCDFLRAERRFSGLPELKLQMEKDKTELKKQV